MVTLPGKVRYLKLCPLTQLKFYRLEIIGRYPNSKEAHEHGLRETAPLWLPTKTGLQVYTTDICDRLRHTRDWSHHI